MAINRFGLDAGTGADLSILTFLYTRLPRERRLQLLSITPAANKSSWNNSKTVRMEVDTKRKPSTTETETMLLKKHYTRIEDSL